MAEGELRLQNITENFHIILLEGLETPECSGSFPVNVKSQNYSGYWKLGRNEILCQNFNAAYKVNLMASSEERECNDLLNSSNETEILVSSSEFNISRYFLNAEFVATAHSGRDELELFQSN